MQQSNAPSKLLLPFANAGSKNTIPAASQIGITPGAASLTDGFPPLTRTPIAAGGVPPSGLDMNGILYAISAIARWANAGGGFNYDAAFAADANVNGYPKGARVLRTDGKGYWLNTIDGNTVDPESGTVGQAATAGWVPDLTNGITTVALTNANVTLTPLQYGTPVIILTGVLAANLNLVFPAIQGEWVVVNNTTGNFSVTAKTQAGTGVAVTQGTVQPIYGDGTNIAAMSAGPNGNAALNFFVASGTQSGHAANAGQLWARTGDALSVAFRNRLMNGAMLLDQYNLGVAVSSLPLADTFVLDRWAIYTTVASKFNFQQNAGGVTPPAGFTKYAGITVATQYAPAAGDLFLFRQKIEGVNIADLAWGTANAKPVTFQFWVHSDITGAHSGAIVNNATNRSYPFSFTITAANTWEQKIITIPGETTGTWATDSNVGMALAICLGAGSTWTGAAGAWANAYLYKATGAQDFVNKAAGSHMYITGTQLEAGSTPSDFERLDYTQNFMRCARYCWIPRGNFPRLDFAGSTNYQFAMTLTTPTRMRATPTVTYNNGQTNSNCVAMTIQGWTPDSIYYGSNVSGSGNATCYAIDGFKATAEL